jgi:hypothetical protein
MTQSFQLIQQNAEYLIFRLFSNDKESIIYMVMEYIYEGAAFVSEVNE